MSHNKGLLLAFYGDDFTGSTDALEFLGRVGAKTVLFIEPPAEEQLKQYDGLQAIGVAGMTRSMPPLEMEAVLRSAFAALKKLGVRHVHYKVCSTFDSSPSTGSIGKAIDIGAEIFDSRFVPLLVAAPILGRYCAFGNLFARMGIGSEGKIYRLDRHPSMRKHPTTPSDESDLTLHLAKQTAKKVGLVDILEIEQEEMGLRRSTENVISKGAEIVLFDAIYQHQMKGIGALIDSYAGGQTLFSAGSSGVEMALGSYWTQDGILESPSYWIDPGKSEPLLVASGSCSPIASAQIEWALCHGFKEVLLDIDGIAGSKDYATLIREQAQEVAAIIKEGMSVILHTGCNKAANSKKLNIENTAHLFGTALGDVVRKAVDESPVKRIVVAGGDSSSFAARAMGIQAVEMIAPLAPGAPLCKAYAPGSPVDGVEVNFKGGQVGKEDYFGMVREGKYIS